MSADTWRPLPPLGTATVLRADARRLPLADNSVDLVVSSPPYFSLRSYQDGGEHYDGQIGAEPTPTEFVDALIEVTREAMRVLKPSGSIWINLGDKYASYEGGRSKSQSGLINASLDLPRVPKGYGLTGGGTVKSKSLMCIPWRYAIRCTDELGLILRAEVIWSKPNGLPESVTDRVRRSHETWFHFTAQPRYFSAVDEIREEYAPDSLRLNKVGPASMKGRNVNLGSGSPQTGRSPLGKLPGSVWTIPTEPLKVPEELGISHFAAFPSEWPKRIIQGWSPSGGTVLDIFGGTGTTAMVAKALGRDGISVDLSADYCRLAQWRTNDLTQIDRVRCSVALGEKRPSKRLRETYEMIHADITPGLNP